VKRAAHRSRRLSPARDGSRTLMRRAFIMTAFAFQKGRLDKRPQTKNKKSLLRGSVPHPQVATDGDYACNNTSTAFKLLLNLVNVSAAILHDKPLMTD